MWFKQLQLFQLTDSLNYSAEELINKLEPFAFTPCLPSLPESAGWVSPLNEDEMPLVRSINGCLMFCLQIQEKILPSSVVRQTLDDKIKEIEKRDDRKIYRGEKLTLKDAVTSSLLARAFTKLTHIHAYIDTRNHWLLLASTNPKKTEQFISLFKKSVTENVFPFELKNVSTLLTDWLKTQNYPSIFAIEKAGTLQHPNEKSRVIRCQQQNLQAPGIQSLLEEGCTVKQLALSWQDRLNLVLTENFLIQSIKYQDELIAQSAEMEAESKQQQFDADFLIMTDTLSHLLQDLLDIFLDTEQQRKTQSVKATTTIEK